MNDNRNLLVLSVNVENAFDALRISFVPNPNSPLIRQNVMKVWDATVLDTPVYPGATFKIGEFADSPLTFTVNGQPHSPFRRCLSYHALMAYIGGRHKRTASQTQADVNGILGGAWQKYAVWNTVLVATDVDFEFGYNWISANC